MGQVGTVENLRAEDHRALSWQRMREIGGPALLGGLAYLEEGANGLRSLESEHTIALSETVDGGERDPADGGNRLIRRLGAAGIETATEEQDDAHDGEDGDVASDASEPSDGPKGGEAPKDEFNEETGTEVKNGQIINCRDCKKQVKAIVLKKDVVYCSNSKCKSAPPYLKKQS